MVEKLRCMQKSIISDVDECKMVGIQCYMGDSQVKKPSVEACSNYEGGYECKCKTGYYRPQGTDKE